ncbi:hypothetical protein ULMS_05350 [Patiriisocius marinistellae]|uniref:Uncharacterized protein n=1 Tax=Patiriisocius marinistellae TaxID=2494560 RepID=A0A5J4FSH6_9FLAO|nr:hypothetical protein ULMS_05350 [Patiriisocius marinistellae]
MIKRSVIGYVASSKMVFPAIVIKMTYFGKNEYENTGSNKLHNEILTKARAANLLAATQAFWLFIDR